MKGANSDEGAGKNSYIKRNDYYYIADGNFSLVPINIAAFILGHLLVIPAIYIWFYETCLATQIYVNGLLLVTAIGVTAGAHRLWSHRSYRAKLPLRIFLATCQSIAGQNCLLIWCRDHRVHHKYSDTDGDPHNIKRGVFFSHVGWLLRRKHPAVKEFGSKVPIDDLESDRVIKLQSDAYYLIYIIFSFALPIAIPVVLWDESLIVSVFTSYILRTAIVLHDTWFVNSAAHFVGSRPFNPLIEPVENVIVSFFTIGEGYHNYHHVFPFDYKAGELGSRVNITRYFIEGMAALGLAYDLKSVRGQTVNALKRKHQ